MSDEQLVRMGRPDLYRRCDTEMKGGRRVARDGAKPVRILCVDSPNDTYPCVYVHGNGTLMSCMPSGKWSENSGDCADDLVAIDPAPKLVPWEFCEIPVDHWFRVHNRAIAFRIGHTSKPDRSVYIESGWVNTDDLLSHYEHSAHHCGPFEPCGKLIS